MSNRTLIIVGSFLLALAPVFGQNPTPLLVKSEGQLIAVLKSDAELKEKADACRQLAVIGSKSAVDALAALLGDEKLSHMARYGLETIPDPAVDRALRDALQKLDGRLAIGVVGSIGVRRDADAIPLLALKVRGADEAMLQTIARTLGQVGTLAAAKTLQEAWADLPSPRHLLLSEGLLRCAEALTAKGLRHEAMAIYDLLRQAQAPHQVRAAAWRGAILTAPNGLAVLREGLANRDLVVMDAALRTAMEMGGSQVTALLASQAVGLPTDRQVLVIQALGKLGEAEALPALLEWARSGAKPVRLAAIRALPANGRPPAVSALLRLMRDSDREIAQAAQESLAALPSAEADAAVVGLLRSEGVREQLGGLELVGRRRMLGQVPMLVELASKGEAQVRPTAIRKLGEMGDQKALDALTQLLKGSTETADLDALERALTQLAPQSKVEAGSPEKIAQFLAELKPAQRKVYLSLLTVAGGESALKAVRNAANDANPELRTEAIRALGSWKTVEAAPELLDLAKGATNATDKLLCLRSYLGWAANAELPAKQRLTMCQKAGGLVQLAEAKKLLLSALGNLGVAESLALVKPYLDDAEVKEEASAATVAIADKLLKGRNSAKAAPGLIEPLQKAEKAAANSALAERAKALLEQAKAKSAGS